MAVKFDTSVFVRSHGKEPKGTGMWGFRREASHGADAEVFWVTGSFKEAKAEAKVRCRHRGFVDAVVTVMP